MASENAPITLTIPNLTFSAIPFIAVHVGAGRHATKHSKEYKKLCNKACLLAMKHLDSGKTASSAASLALAILEDSELTNAGRGSCLNQEGRVECEAALMEARGLKWAAVGALQGIANPIHAAEELLKMQQEEDSHMLSRMPPCLLVGEGAYNFAVQRGVKLADTTALVTSKARLQYESYSKRLAQARGIKRRKLEEMGDREATADGASSAKKLTLETQISDGCHTLDTIGVIVMDSTGHVVSGASSGGIALKHPGRLGQVCHYGAGCWAEERGDRCTGVVTTGCGEQLIRTCLAKEVGATLLETSDSFSLQDVIQNRFMSSPALTDDVAKGHGLVCGGLGFIYFREEQRCELHFWHSTASLALGYMTGVSPKPDFVLSRMNLDNEGKAFQLQMVLQEMNKNLPL